jgi:curved DNA-binding protein CbpA
MGNNQSAIDPVHLRIYSNILKIHEPSKRIQIINTCFASIEYVNSAKRGGVYSYLLNYVAIVNSGGKPPILPGEQQNLHKGNIQQDIPVSRSLQPNFSLTTISPNHPSVQNVTNPTTYSQQVIIRSDSTPSWKVITDTPKQKAMTYFASCLEVLGIQEDVSLTEESLKSSYKKMALKAHPDKGGSEEYFEAVTRAYAYLSEILKHMKGGRREVNGRVDAPVSLGSARDTEADKWKHSEPVRLNAKNLDMNAFNTLFEQTHIPDPDSDGYGDWLKGEDTRSGTSGPKFSGEFNRDVFNRMFEDEARKNQMATNSLIVHPGQMALTLNPNSGVSFVGEKSDSYTAATNSKFQYTDLRGAYTTDSTISDKISNVQVKERNFDQYRASREKAPDPFSQSELHGIREFENRQKQQDEMRERRRGEMAVRNQNYFDQMKRLVVTDGVDLNQGKLTY